MQTLADIANPILQRSDDPWKIVLCDGDASYFGALPLKQSWWEAMLDGPEWTRKKWTDTIQSWIKQGHSIEVILVDPVDDGLQQWKELAQTSPKSVTIQVLNPSSATDDETRAKMRRLSTTHPILFYGPNGNRAFYLEGRHDKSNTHAYNIRTALTNIEHATSKSFKLFKICEELLLPFIDPEKNGGKRLQSANTSPAARA
ncbi:MAG: hypothetical protein AAF988_01340 [Pseudomonadota bacterium]